MYHIVKCRFMKLECRQGGEVEVLLQIICSLWSRKYCAFSTPPPPFYLGKTPGVYRRGYWVGLGFTLEADDK